MLLSILKVYFQSALNHYQLIIYIILHNAQFIYFCGVCDICVTLINYSGDRGEDVVCIEIHQKSDFFVH